MLCFEVRFSRQMQGQNRGRYALAGQMSFLVFVVHTVLTEEQKGKHPDEKQS